MDDVGCGIQVATGTVIKFDDVRGYGFVSPDDGGEDVFLHVNDLHFDKQLLSTGVEVEFVPEEGERGLKASRVRLLEQPQRTQAAPAVQPAPARAGNEDELCDVLSLAELESELIEALLEAAPTLTGAQLVAVRQRMVAVARDHGWVED
ncbi:cold-shock protein [Amycolatopsis sp. NPDC059027]|uniref:cold-shock protein n=1 Tax=unclassified Amycolatopsis TaxID=2618356 RepID=UPI003670C7E8